MVVTLVAALALFLPLTAAPCVLETSGPATVFAGDVYTLSLNATAGTPTSWTINWGDGTIVTYAGNPASVTHTYTAAIPSVFNYGILASAVCGGSTYFQNDLVVSSVGNDRVNWYTHDAATNVAVVDTPAQSGPDAGLNEPVGAILGPDGNVYVSGWTSANVLRYDPSTGAFIDELVDGAVLAPPRTSTLGMAFGPDGNLYVAIPTSAEVLRFDANSGAFIDAFVPAGLGGLTEAEGLTFGPDGNLYVSDYTTNAVYRYNGTTGAFIDIFVAAGSGGLRDPEDLTFGPDGNLYVASDRDDNVLRFNGTSGAFIDQFVTSLSGGLEEAQGVVFGPDGNLYVSSWKNDAVYRYDGTTGAFIDIYVSSGLGGLNTAGHLEFLAEHQVKVLARGADATRPIVVDRGQISDASCGGALNDFPMLFDITDPDLRFTGSGGDVTDPDGDDIIFVATDAATCGGTAPCTLDHEIETYIGATGALVAWVRIPSLNTATAGSDTVIHIRYGNPFIKSPTQNPAGVWDASYQGVWHLGDGDSTAAGFYQDSSTNGEHGTLTDADGDSATVAGRIAGAYDFNGDADRIDIPNFSQYLTTAMTISGWVRPSPPQPDHDGYFGIRNGDVDHSFYVLQLLNTSDLEFRFRNSVGGAHDAPAASAVSAGTWVHVALTYDGSDLTSYVDGRLISQDATANGVFSSSGHAFSIGAVGGNPMDGTVDEVRVSNTARPGCWVAASYNNQAWPDKALTPSPDPSPNPSEGFYGLGVPTAVELVTFTARGRDGSVELAWETGSELNNLGFHLYRATAAGGPYERVTESLIPGLGSSPAGARYRYLDVDLTNGATYFYELEDVETTGGSERHGPVGASPLAGEVVDEPLSSEERDTRARLTYGEPEAGSFRVMPQKNGVILELDTGGFVAVAQDDGTVRLEVPGLEELSGRGLPVKRAWVEALAGRDVKLVSVRAREVERFEGLHPSASLISELSVSSRGTVRATLRREGRRHARAEGAHLLDVAYQGVTKKALVELSPLTWDGNGLLLAKKLEVRLRFRGREATSRRAQKPKRSVVARLSAAERGLYAVRLSELVGLRRARNAKVRLSRQDESVAYHLDDGVMYFWSEGASANPYGTEAVYELEVGVVGERMEEADTSSASSAYYMETLELEENRYYQAPLVDAPDVWLWEVLFAPDRKSFPFEVHELSSGAASPSLTLWLQGTSDFPAVEDHHVRVFVNGIPVGEGRWDGKTAHQVDVELGAGILQEGANTLELESVLDTGAAHSMMMVDRFRVRYPRSTTVLERAPYVIELTESSPRWVSSRSGFDASGAYVAVDEPLPPERRSVVPTRLRKKSRADYLVIGPEALIATAKPLIEHRERQGLRTAMASTEAIASEFGHGELTPQSIRELIGYAYHKWRAPRLRYVLLLGDATYDFKNYLGTKVTNQVPPFMVRTSYLWTASDPAYAAVNGDDSLPDVAIGRLPAKSSEELRAMVAKIIAYESGELAEEAPFVLVADDADEAGDFEKDADELASTLLAGHETRRIYLSRLGTSAAREAIVEGFDRGASTMSYLGHGAINLWAAENLFNNARVETLSPQSQQPVVLTMNCLNGYFHFPYFDSLAEALVKRQDKGAIAAFSPSGLSLNGPAHRYHQALLQELVSVRHSRLGDAVVAAQEAYAETGAFPELLSIYHLFGDPALKLR